MDGMAGMALILVIAATLATSVCGDPITVKLRLREEREVLREVRPHRTSISRLTCPNARPRLHLR